MLLARFAFVALFLSSSTALPLKLADGVDEHDSYVSLHTNGTIASSDSNGGQCVQGKKCCMGANDCNENPYQGGSGLNYCYNLQGFDCGGPGHGHCRCHAPMPPPPLPPPSPIPQLPPPLPPGACMEGGAPDCHLPPYFCAADYAGATGYLFDSITLDPSSSDYDDNWNDQCADEFWANANTFDWNTFAGSVFGCNGGECKPPGDTTVMCKADLCPATPNNGCALTLNRYSSVLVYESQRRTLAILDTSGFIGDNTSQTIAISQLTQVQAALQSFSTALQARAPPIDPNNRDCLTDSQCEGSGCPEAGPCDVPRDCSNMDASSYIKCYDPNAMPATQQVGSAESPTCRNICVPRPTDMNPNSGVALVQAQINSVATMTQMVTQVTMDGYIPAYSLDFYQSKLQSYVHSFQEVASELKKDLDKQVNFQLFATALSMQSTQLVGKESVTQETQTQILASMSMAVQGMSNATAGLQEMQEVLTEKAEDLEDALEQWRKSQIISTLISIAKDVALCAIGVGEVALAKDLSAAQQTAQTVSEIGSMLKDVTGGIMDIGNLLETAPPDLTTAVNDLVSQLQAFGVDATAAQGSIAVVAQQLSSILPGMGTGYWAQYVATVKQDYNQFLTGYDKAVNLAAQSFLDFLDVQATFGNDFVNQASNFISTVQVYQINQAQIQANQATSDAMDQTYEVAQVTEAYSMMQLGILSVQMNTLAMQLEATSKQVCQGYAYQATRIYHQCIGSADNLLSNMCGGFAAGNPTFEPFFFKPCQDSATIKMLTLSNTYVDTLSKLYGTDAECLMNYVTAEQWGTATEQSAPQTPWVELDVKVWDPPLCDESAWVNVTRLEPCNDTDPPNIVFTPCPADFVPEEGYTCCNVTAPAAPPGDSCDVNAPVEDSVVYITRETFNKFASTSTEEWGKLQFSTSFETFKQRLAKWDEMFIRGAVAFADGITIGTEANGLWAEISSVGAMATRVLNRDWESDPNCASSVAQDPHNLCRYKNYSFVGSPAGDNSQVVNYKSNYESAVPNPEQNPPYICGDPETRIEAKPVFSTGHAVGEYYCSGDDYDALDNPSDWYASKAPPYNFASVFGQFQLKLSNLKGPDAGVAYRSVGINLANMTRLRLGLWLKTFGYNNGGQDSCPTSSMCTKSAGAVTQQVNASAAAGAVDADLKEA